MESHKRPLGDHLAAVVAFPSGRSTPSARKRPSSPVPSRNQTWPVHGRASRMPSGAGASSLTGPLPSRWSLKNEEVGSGKTSANLVAVPVSAPLAGGGKAIFFSGPCFTSAIPWFRLLDTDVVHFPGAHPK